MDKKNDSVMIITEAHLIECKSLLNDCVGNKWYVLLSDHIKKIEHQLSLYKKELGYEKI